MRFGRYARATFSSLFALLLLIASFQPAAHGVDLPSLSDRAVPNNLKPSVGLAPTDRPQPYLDRCHTQQNLSASTAPCTYGDLKSKTSIVLFGDSHALSWFPAIEVLAKSKSWKLYSYTMSSCWPSDIPAWNSTKNELMENCDFWREETIAKIQQIKPAMIFVAGTRGFATIDEEIEVMTGAARTTSWEEGMTRTLAQLHQASDDVVFLGDTPVSKFNVPKCLAKYRTSILKCSTPYAKAVSQSWIAEEQKVAEISGASYVDPTSWICESDPCSPIKGRFIIYVDGGHLTATFARLLERPLWQYLTSRNS